MRKRAKIVVSKVGCGPKALFLEHYLLKNSAFCRSISHEQHPQLDMAQRHCCRVYFTRIQCLLPFYHPGKEEVIMVKQLAKGKQWLDNAYWSAVGMASAAMLTIQPVMATAAGTGTIWARFSTILKDVYGQIVAISTIVAVTVAAIALLVRMISRNQRAVDEATSWLKRIVVTWIVLNSLGFIVAYLQPLIQGGNYNG